MPKSYHLGEVLKVNVRQDIKIEFDCVTNHNNWIIRKQIGNGFKKYDTALTESSWSCIKRYDSKDNIGTMLLCLELIFWIVKYLTLFHVLKNQTQIID